MISPQSRRNLEVAFHEAVQGSLVRHASDTCIMAPADDDKLAARSEDKRLFLTLSSFVFRLLIIFHVAETAAARSYYGPIAGTQTLHDVLAESANLCGGALGRYLAESFPHLAMSTPHIVSGRCMAFLSELKPQYVSSYLITINDSVQLQATLCLCCSVPIEVTLNAVTRSEQNIGDLEMF